MIYFPSSIDSLGTELAFYARTVKGRFQILIQQRSRKKSWELVLDPQLNGVDMKHIT